MKSFYLVSNGDSFRLTKKRASISQELLDATQLSSEPLDTTEDVNKHKRDFLKVLGVADSFRLVKRAPLVTRELVANVVIQPQGYEDLIEDTKRRNQDLSKVLGVKDSFRLTKKHTPITREILGATQPNEPPDIAGEINEDTRDFLKVLGVKDSFRLTKKRASISQELLDATQLSSEPLDTTEDVNKHKRDFLKVLGVSGLGLAGTLLFPKDAEALTFGGTPAASVVGVKNAANTRINPATEETASSLLKTSDLNFDGSGYLNVNVQSSSASGASSFSDSGDVSKLALVDGDRHVQVDVLSSALPSSASTETTLQTISFGGFKFAIRFATVGDVDYVGEAAIGTATSAASWRIRKIDSSSGVVITWAGTGVFNQVWDDRASLSYS